MKAIQEPKLAIVALPEPLYWLYVNPLTGKYACTNTTPVQLAVFRSERSGRLKEPQSFVLRRMTGHACTWNEVQEIARLRYEGRYQLID